MRRLRIVLLPLILSGCLVSKSKLFPDEKASTPIPAGIFVMVAPADPLPRVTGPIKLTVEGTEYTMTGALPSSRPFAKFHLFQLVEGKNIYVAQATELKNGTDQQQDGIIVFFGTLTSDGFCAYSDPANGYPGMTARGLITSPETLLRYLIDHVDEIALKKQLVCWVRLRTGL